MSSSLRCWPRSGATRRLAALADEAYAAGNHTLGERYDRDAIAAYTRAEELSIAAENEDDD